MRVTSVDRRPRPAKRIQRDLSVFSIEMGQALPEEAAGLLRIARPLPLRLMAQGLSG